MATPLWLTRVIETGTRPLSPVAATTMQRPLLLLINGYCRPLMPVSDLSCRARIYLPLLLQLVPLLVDQMRMETTRTFEARALLLFMTTLLAQLLVANLSRQQTIIAAAQLQFHPRQQSHRLVARVSELTTAPPMTTTMMMMMMIRTALGRDPMTRLVRLVRLVATSFKCHRPLSNPALVEETSV